MGEPQESRVPSARSRRLGERTALTLSNLLPSRVFRSIRHDLVDGQVAPHPGSRLGARTGRLRKRSPPIERLRPGDDLRRRCGRLDAALLVVGARGVARPRRGRGHRGLDLLPARGEQRLEPCVPPARLPRCLRVEWPPARQPRAARQRRSRHTTITLARGDTAHALLRITDVGNLPASTCSPATAQELKVFPPGERSSKFVPFSFKACSKAGPAFLSVRAVEPGVGIPGFSQ